MITQFMIWFSKLCIDFISIISASVIIFHDMFYLVIALPVSRLIISSCYLMLCYRVIYCIFSIPSTFHSTDLILSPLLFHNISIGIPHQARVSISSTSYHYWWVLILRGRNQIMSSYCFVFLLNLCQIYIDELRLPLCPIYVSRGYARLGMFFVLLVCNDPKGHFWKILRDYHFTPPHSCSKSCFIRLWT